MALTSKAKLIIGYDWTPKLFLDHKTLFWPFNPICHCTVQILFRSSMTLTLSTPFSHVGHLTLPSAPPTLHLGDLLVGL